MAGGEQLRITQPIKKLFGKLKDCLLYNHYGPSESHVTARFLLPSDSARWLELPPLGRPIANARLYILASYLQPVPVGVVVELYIGGDCLAHGYLKRPHLTAERFVSDSFSGKSGTELYRTGDLVRYLPDGNIEFVGRNDFQLKIRGIRIEPGEIETALGQVEGVKRCAVMARENADGEKQLVAYMVLDGVMMPTAREWRQNLPRILPEYMIPSIFLDLKELPLNPNGKVDRTSLPTPEFNSDVDYRAPRTTEEAILCRLFAEMLELDRIGIDDDFFQMGGHSLLATRLVTRIRETLNVELALRTLFEASTVGDLVWHVSCAKPSAVKRSRVTDHA